MAALAACQTEPPCGPRNDHSVLACLDGTAVTRAEVEPHLRPPAPKPGVARPPDPRELALEDALRVRLFAREGARRGLGVGREDAPQAQRIAVLNRALIRDELRRLGIGPAAVTDDEARSYYAEHPAEISAIDAVACRAIFTADAERAEALFRTATGATEEKFAALAREESIDATASQGGDLGEIHDDDWPKEMVRLAHGLRERGAVGGPILLPDGRYVILYATRVDVTVEPFERVAPRVKALLSRRREVAALDELARQLRARANIRIFWEELARWSPEIPSPGSGGSRP